MDWSIFYNELKGWQNAVGSLIGFCGLIAAALFNARLNRKRDTLLRDDEARAVAAALYEEIVLVRGRLARLANAVGRRYFDHGLGRHRSEPFDPHFLRQVSLPKLVIYPALADRVGTLPPEIALEIVRFYARVDEAQTRLEWLPNDPNRPFTYGPSWVLDPAIDAVRDVQSALRQIETFVGIDESSDVPELKVALEAQEHEDLMQV